MALRISNGLLERGLMFLVGGFVLIALERVGQRCSGSRIMKTSAATRKLEKLLLRRKELGSILLNLDMYERWGQGSDPEMNQELKRGPQYGRQTNQIESQIKALSAKAGDEVIREWANAHLALLQEFVDRMSSQKKRSTEIFVAREEMQGWEKVKKREIAFVRQNVYYIAYDEDLYESYFGQPQ